MRSSPLFKTALLLAGTCWTLSVAASDLQSDLSTVAARTSVCRAGMKLLSDNMYTYPASTRDAVGGKRAWADVYGRDFKTNYLPACNDVAAFLKKYKGAPSLVAVEAALAPAGGTLEGYMSGRNGVTFMGDRMLSYCPNLHRSQFDCVAGKQRSLNYAIPGVMATLDELDKVSLTQDANKTSKITVLFAYTGEAAAAMGGVAALRVEADNGMRLLNEALKNSETHVSVEAITQMVRVDGVPVPTTGDDYHALIGAMSDVNGKFAGVHQARQTYQADIVALVTSGFMQGVGNLGSLPVEGNADSAFMVTHYKTFGGSYVFPHEFGHVLGCGHQASAADSGGIYAYSRGYNPGASWRTIEANGGVAIPYFSSDRTVSVVLPGATSATVTRIGDANADCSRSIRETGPTYATFGDHLPSPTVRTGAYATTVIQDPSSMPATPIATAALTVSKATCSAGGAISFTYTAADSVTTGFRVLDSAGQYVGGSMTSLNPGADAKGPSFGGMEKGDTVEIWQLPAGASPDPQSWSGLAGAQRAAVTNACP